MQQDQKDRIEILGKDFEYVRIENVKSDNPLVFVEDRNINQCIIAIEKLNAKTVYTSTETIDFLEHSAFKDITKLSVNGFNLDISPIHNLKNLEYLALSNYNEEKDIVFDFSNFKKLNYFRGDMPKKYINFNTLLEIEELILRDFIEEDLSCKKFKKLKKLELNDTKIKSLNNITPLQELVINGAENLKSISGLERANNLEKLSLQGIPNVSDISSLKSLTSLKALVLSGMSKTENIETIGLLTQLKELQLSQIGNCSSLKFIENLKHLNSIYISPWNVNVSDNSFIPYTKKLNELGKLKQIIQWEEITKHLDENGQKFYDEFFGVSKLQLIKREFQFHQYPDYSEPYTKENCALIDDVIYNLIDALEELKEAQEALQLKAIKDAVLALNKINNHDHFF